MALVIKSPTLASEHVTLGSHAPADQPLARLPEESSSTLIHAQQLMQTVRAEQDVMVMDDYEAQEHDMEVGTEIAIPDTQSYENFWEEHRETLRSLEQQAIQDGYRQGYLQGESDAQLKHAEAVESLLQLVDKGQASLSQLLQASEMLIGAIVFEAAGKVIGDQLLTVEGCRNIIGKVIKNTLDQEVILLKVSPQDFERLQFLTNNGDGSGDVLVDRLTKLPIEADSAVELGGCVVELRDGSIDGRIETQMRMFAQSIKDAFNLGK